MCNVISQGWVYRNSSEYKARHRNMLSRCTEYQCIVFNIAANKVSILVQRAANNFPLRMQGLPANILFKDTAVGNISIIKSIFHGQFIRLKYVTDAWGYSIPLLWNKHETIKFKLRTINRHSLLLSPSLYLSHALSPFTRGNKRRIKFRNASVMPEYKCPLICRIAR